MGLFDFLNGGSPADKAQKLKAKITQKYGDASVRQKAIEQVAQLKVPEAIHALLARFTITVEPQTTDAFEKDRAFELICAFRQEAVEPVRQFLKTSDQAITWAMTLLSSLLPSEEVNTLCLEQLTSLGAGYARDPQKKLVLLGHLEGLDDARVDTTVLPFLEDMSDDVKIASLKLLGARRYSLAREPILNLLTQEETSKRVQTAALAALCEAELGVQGYREKVEKLISDPYFLDKSSMVKKRG